MIVATSIAELGTRHGLREVCAACGVFDGLHRGHQQIISGLTKLAADAPAAAMVLTFTPHPRSVLCPGSAPSRLTAREQLLRCLSALGVQATVFLPFTRELAAMSPELFLSTHLCPADVRVKGICVGAEWRFGANGRGDVGLLRRFGSRHGWQVVAVPQLTCYGKSVSSTRIREAVADGRLRLAERLLGRPYAIFGRVLRGKGIGGPTFDCPTANIDAADFVLPPPGVYAARGFLEPSGRDVVSERPGTHHPGIAYVGAAPTLAVRAQADACTPAVVEFHAFDYDGDLYGRLLEVEFGRFLRPDKVFPTASALRRQIARDVAVVRRLAEDGGQIRRARS